MVTTKSITNQCFCTTWVSGLHHGCHSDGMTSFSKKGCCPLITDIFGLKKLLPANYLIDIKISQSSQQWKDCWCALEVVAFRQVRQFVRLFGLVRLLHNGYHERIKIGELSFLEKLSLLSLPYVTPQNSLQDYDGHFIPQAQRLKIEII